MSKETKKEGRALHLNSNIVMLCLVPVHLKPMEEAVMVLVSMSCVSTVQPCLFFDFYCFYVWSRSVFTIPSSCLNAVSKCFCPVFPVYSFMHIFWSVYFRVFVSCQGTVLSMSAPSVQSVCSALFCFNLKWSVFPFFG